LITFETAKKQKIANNCCAAYQFKMSLNNLQLTPSEITTLYKNSLVEIPDAGIIQTKPGKETTWNYLGENMKNVLVILMYKDAVHIPDKQLSFFTKLLAACHLNLSDTAILNIYNYKEAGFENLISFFKPKVVFLFGVSPAELEMPLLFPFFQVQAYKNVSYLYSPSLEEIEPDKNLKTSLWACLKKIFNL
jgi:hypothetical protein